MHQPPERLATPPVRTHLLAGQRRNHSGGDRQSPQRHGPRTSSVRPETAGVGGQPNNQNTVDLAGAARCVATHPGAFPYFWCAWTGSATRDTGIVRVVSQIRQPNRHVSPVSLGRRREKIVAHQIHPRSCWRHRIPTASSSTENLAPHSSGSTGHTAEPCFRVLQAAHGQLVRVGRGVGYPATNADRIPFCLERGHAGVGVQTAECVTRLPVPRIGPYEGHGRRRRRHWYLRQWRLARGRAIRSRQP